MQTACTCGKSSLYIHPCRLHCPQVIRRSDATLPRWCLQAWLPLGLPRCPRLHKTALDVCVLAAAEELRAEGEEPGR